jgi:hypothetical protein
MQAALKAVIAKGVARYHHRLQPRQAVSSCCIELARHRGVVGQGHHPLLFCRAGGIMRRLCFCFERGRAGVLGCWGAWAGVRVGRWGWEGWWIRAKPLGALTPLFGRVDGRRYKHRSDAGQLSPKGTLRCHARPCSVLGLL